MSSSALSLPAFETGRVSRSAWYLPYPWNVVIPFMIGWTNTKSIFHLGLRLWIFFTQTNRCHTQSDEMRVCEVCRLSWDVLKMFSLPKWSTEFGEVNPSEPHLYLSRVNWCDCWNALCSWGANKQITAWPPYCHLCIWMQYFTWIQDQCRSSLSSRLEKGLFLVICHRDTCSMLSDLIFVPLSKDLTYGK